MKQLLLCDTTLKLYKNSLSFRKKIDIAGILDRMKISAIELGEISASAEDRLLLQTVSGAIGESILAVSVGLDPALPLACSRWLNEVKNLRIQVSAPMSTARMEYVYHKKPNDLLAAVTETVTAAKNVSPDVEFCADDATRADFGFLKSVLSAAVTAGATSVTLCDTAGTTLPDEIAKLIADLQTEIPALKDVLLGVECKNGLGLANAAAVAAMKAGISQLKVSACHPDTVSLAGLVHILNAKVGTFPFSLSLDTENVEQPIRVVRNLCDLHADGKSPFENGLRTERSEIFFSAEDTEENVFAAISKMGYLLSAEDRDEVFKAFRRITARKEKIDLHELEVIVASEALQVPQTYKLESSVVTTGNTCEALAHIKLSRKEEILDGISLGNGSVDASFLAIEKITGCHYELDDFQIQAITEGKEAMGQTFVKLRSRGKVFSGNGVSTDIVISAIEAYLNALNKIVYEEGLT